MVQCDGDLNAKRMQKKSYPFKGLIKNLKEYNGRVATSRDAYSKGKSIDTRVERGRGKEYIWCIFLDIERAFDDVFLGIVKSALLPAVIPSKTELVFSLEGT